MTVRVKVILPNREEKTARLVENAPVELLLEEIARTAPLRSGKGLRLCKVIPNGSTLEEVNIRDGDILLVYDVTQAGPLVQFEGP